MRRLALAAAILLTSCFEPVVEESLHLEFDEVGSLAITATTNMTRRDYPKGHAVNGRLRDLRDAAQRGDDFWGRQLGMMSVQHERVIFDYTDKVLVGVARSVSLKETAEVEHLFRAFGVGTFVTREDDLVGFEVYPARATRATEEQRTIARRDMKATSEAFAAYLDAARRLYEYLERHPDRAKPLFERLFETSEIEIDEDELALIEAVGERMNAITKIFELHESQPYTLDELSRLVFNPFPAETTIQIQGRVRDVVGFEAVGPNRYKVPTIGLWGALAAFEGKWLSPDLLVVDVNLKMKGEKNTAAAVEQLLGQPRRYEPTPRASDILRELETRLAPASVYRLRWELPEKRADSDS